jgi:xanthine dehydrogenase accessory factor
MVFALITRTEGSTYGKCGTPLLFAEHSEYSGLLSGGCLEGDLRERAQKIFKIGGTKLVRYDERGSSDPVFGLGSGCEGAMDVFMLRVGLENDWQPLAHLQSALKAHVVSSVGLVVESQRSDLRAGDVILPTAGGFEAALLSVARTGRADWLPATTGGRVFGLPLVLPPRVLLLGSGPDAEPVVDFAARLGWKVSIYDHRPARLDSGHFPGAERAVLGRPTDLADELNLESFEAAIVMSHHLESDAAYLRALATSSVGYIGLLGPVSRRETLRKALGREFHSLSERLRSPVGLALGGRSSSSIALAIVAEIHAWLYQRDETSWHFSSTNANLAESE